MVKVTQFIKDLSIKWRLFLLQAFLVFLIVAVIGAVCIFELQGGIEKNQRERLLALAGEVANVSGNNLRNAEDSLINLAKGHAMNDYLAHGSDHQLENEFKKHEMLFPDISYINADGKEAVKMTGGKPVSDYVDYSNSPLLRRASNHRGGVVMGAPYMSASLKTPVVDLACRGCGSAEAGDFTLRASISLLLLSNALSDIDINSGGFFVLLGEGGNIIASSRPAYLARHLDIGITRNKMEGRDLSKGVQLFGRYRLLGCDCMLVKGVATLSNITAVVAVPYEEYMAPVNSLRSIIILTCMVSFAISILLVHWVVGRFMAPIHLLTKVTNDIASGGALDRYVEWQSKDEIGTLADSFNTMLLRLNGAHHELLYERSYIDNVLLSLADMLVICDESGTISRVNTSCQNKLQYGYGDLIGKPVRKLFKDAGGEISALIKDIDNYNLIHNIETLMLVSSGEEIPVMVSASVIRDEAHRAPHGLVFIAKDITDRKRSEWELQQQRDELRDANRRLEVANSQLLQAEKLAAIGQLAAGVAHEINNPIGYVNSNLATLEEYIGGLLQVVDVYNEAEPLLQEHEATLATIRKIKEATDLEYIRTDLIHLLRESQEGMSRVKQIIMDLKSFSRVDSQHVHLCDLREGLDSTLNIVHNELKYKAEVIKEYGQIPEVACNLGQINQVFMNILINAAQSIDVNGTIWVRTGARENWVWVEIEDTGVGIAAEHLNRIFEPFFTTKPVGKGTGLGLALSYGIIEKHGGRIEVNSEAGKGTRFRIWLPMSGAQVNIQASGI